jgi:hypothetical protein
LRQPRDLKAQVRDVEKRMDSSEAELLARRWAEEGVARGDIEAFDELASVDALDHGDQLGLLRQVEDR